MARKDSPLPALSELVTRSEAAFKLFRDFPASGLGEVLGASLKKLIELQGLSEPKSLGAMDLYDRPVDEVQHLLDRQNIGSKPADVVAYSPENFRNTAWTIAPGENVTLLVYDGRVVGVQKGIPESDDPHQ